jgi:dCTP deaminase
MVPNGPADLGAAPKSSPSGFWSRKTIEARNKVAAAAGKPLIQNFAESRLDRASYRLSVGEEIYVSPSSNSEPKSKRLLKEKESCIIPPGQFAFLTTEEEICIPDDTIAFITLRSKATKFRGLVNVSGFHVDPGYDGKLIFAVFNAGPGPVHVARSDEWFEIFFASLDTTTSGEKNKPGYKGIPNELITSIAGEFQTFSGLNAKIDETKVELDERIQKIEREHSVVRWSVALILGAIIAFGMRQCSGGATASASADYSTSYTTTRTN